MTMAITDIKILDAGKDANAPAGYHKVPVDLNWGAGGKFLYLIYRREEDKQLPGEWITDVTVVEGEGVTAVAGWHLDRTDLNRGAGGKYLYLTYKKDANPNREPIKDIVILDTKTPQNDKPSGYQYVDRDLNQGAGGKYLYLCYLTGRPDRLTPSWAGPVTPSMFKQAIQHMLATHETEQREEVNRMQTAPDKITIWWQVLSVATYGLVAANKTHSVSKEIYEGSRKEDETTWQTKVGVQYQTSAEASLDGVTVKAQMTASAEFTYTRRQLEVHEQSTRITTSDTYEKEDNPYTLAVVQVGDVLESLRSYSAMDPIAEVPSWRHTSEAKSRDGGHTWDGLDQ